MHLNAELGHGPKLRGHDASDSELVDGLSNGFVNGAGIHRNFMERTVGIGVRDFTTRRMHSGSIGEEEAIMPEWELWNLHSTNPAHQGRM